MSATREPAEPPGLDQQQQQQEEAAQETHGVGGGGGEAAAAAIAASDGVAGAQDQQALLPPPTSHGQQDSLPTSRNSLKGRGEPGRQSRHSGYSRRRWQQQQQPQPPVPFGAPLMPLPPGAFSALQPLLPPHMLLPPGGHVPVPYAVHAAAGLAMMPFVGPPGGAPFGVPAATFYAPAPAWAYQQHVPLQPPPPKAPASPASPEASAPLASPVAASSAATASPEAPNHETASAATTPTPTPTPMPAAASCSHSLSRTGSGDTTASSSGGSGSGRARSRGSHAARRRSTPARSITARHDSSDVVPLMQLCHVLHTRKEQPDLEHAQVRALVAAQLAAGEPVRPHWYRPARAAAGEPPNVSGGSSELPAADAAAAPEAPAPGGGTAGRPAPALPASTAAGGGGGGSSSGRQPPVSKSKLNPSAASWRPAAAVAAPAAPADAAEAAAAAVKASVQPTEQRGSNSNSAAPAASSDGASAAVVLRAPLPPWLQGARTAPALASEATKAADGQAGDAAGGAAGFAAAQQPTATGVFLPRYHTTAGSRE